MSEEQCLTTLLGWQGWAVVKWEQRPVDERTAVVLTVRGATLQILATSPVVSTSFILVVLINLSRSPRQLAGCFCGACQALSRRSILLSISS